MGGWAFMVPFLIPRQLHWPVFQRNNLKQAHNGMTARPKIKSVVFKTIRCLVLFVMAAEANPDD